MAYEFVVGMNVIDETGYQKYREAMAPILAEHAGGFRYDFVVAKTLQSASQHPITRVFAIYFGSLELSKAFFANPAYLKIRQTYFEPAVQGSTVIAAYDRAD